MGGLATVDESSRKKRVAYDKAEKSRPQSTKAVVGVDYKRNAMHVSSAIFILSKIVLLFYNLFYSSKSISAMRTKKN